MKKFFSKTAVGVLALSTILAGCGGGQQETSGNGEQSGETVDSLKIIAAHNQTSPDNPYQTGVFGN